MLSRKATVRADVLPTIAEVFREHGFDGASLSLISERTGLGKGSLYHFFPGGKQEMAAAVLDEIDGWFHRNVFAPLRQDPDAGGAIEQMLQAVEAYFRSGQRVCLVGVFALGDARDRFRIQVRTYFVAWTNDLTDALMRSGHDAVTARELSEETVGSIQGALVLARALDDPQSFQRALNRLRKRLEGRQA
nr:TetR/AcrR family transcriptional regulator [Methylocapsa aurea]